MISGSFEVTEADQGARVDVFLTRTWPEAPSRTFIQKLIAEGRVLVNGLPVKAHHKLETGDTVTAEGTEAVVHDVAPEKIPLDIVYEDAHLLVIHKPVGMLVHPAHGQRTGTLVNALLYHCRREDGSSGLSDISADGDDLDHEPAAFRPGIVHRLDRETSGLILAAKDNVTHVRLARQFEKRRVKKRYLALVRGCVELDEGMIDAPLGRHPSHWDKKAVRFDAEAREAKTFYRVLHRWGRRLTLVALFPLSGRTHQLRVHMAHIGHPILGDTRYGGGEHWPRMFLHAQGIAFSHPDSKQFMEFLLASPPDFLYPPARAVSGEG